jgi:AcrR family transcriptional regulator
VGVSHAAPVHHFGDRAGLLTALAAEGFDLLADDLAAVRGRGIVELGVSYVRFAIEHRAHFEVMFRPDLNAHISVPRYMRQAHERYRPAKRRSGRRNRSSNAVRTRRIAPKRA